MIRMKHLWLILLLITATNTSTTLAGRLAPQKPDDDDAYYRLGLEHYQAGRHLAAIEAYRQAVQLKPDFAAAHNNLGYVYDELGKYQDALKSYERAIRLRPANAV